MRIGDVVQLTGCKGGPRPIDDPPRRRQSIGPDGGSDSDSDGDSGGDDDGHGDGGGDDDNDTDNDDGVVVMRCWC